MNEEMAEFMVGGRAFLAIFLPSTKPITTLTVFSWKLSTPRESLSTNFGDPSYITDRLIRVVNDVVDSTYAIGVYAEGTRLRFPPDSEKARNTSFGLCCMDTSSARLTPRDTVIITRSFKTAITSSTGRNVIIGLSFRRNPKSKIVSCVLE